MEESERRLLQRFARQGDGDAFASLVEHYAGMVFSTCRRVLGNDALAADATQETFFHLVKYADRISESVGSWLHQVATRRAVEEVRRNEARRRREEVYSSDVWRADDPWTEVEPLVDQAMDKLPDDLREVLVLHFLAGKSMTQIAAERGLSQPTVSRRVAVGLEQLRQNLRAKGVLVSATALAAGLAGSAQAAPAALLEALGKIALAQAAATGGLLAATGSASLLATGLKALGVAAAVGTASVAWHYWPQTPPATPAPAALAADNLPPATPAALQPAEANPPEPRTVATPDTSVEPRSDLPRPAVPNPPVGYPPSAPRYGVVSNSWNRSFSRSWSPRPGVNIQVGGSSGGGAATSGNAMAGGGAGGGGGFNLGGGVGGQAGMAGGTGGMPSPQGMSGMFPAGFNPRPGAGGGGGGGGFGFGGSGGGGGGGFSTGGVSSPAGTAYSTWTRKWSTPTGDFTVSGTNGVPARR